MLRTLIVTHGELARALLRSAETIAGHNPALTALCLEWDDDPGIAREKIGAAIGELAAGEELLILTDMYGGTPSNVASGFVEAGRVEMVAGVNLPMVLRLECMADTGRPVSEIADWIASKGRGSIRRQDRKARREVPCDDDGGGGAGE